MDIDADWGEQFAVPLARGFVKFHQEEIEMVLQACQSPIEKSMFMGLLVAGLNRYTAIAIDTPGTFYLGNPKSPALLHIQPQFKVGRFRADFRVGHVFRWGNDDASTAEATTLVECDGHDYHDRTKEQAKRDKSRDRKLLAEGHSVLHFTGSEIWADPFAQAIEVVEYLEKAATKIMEGKFA